MRFHLQTFVIRLYKELSVSIRLPLLRFLSILFLFQIFFSSPLFSQDTTGLGARKVAITKSPETVRYYLDQLKEQCNAQLSFVDEKIPLTATVPVPLTEMPVQELLEYLFQNSDVDYKIHENFIVIKKRQKYTISGYVEDANAGERLIGATVYDPVSYRGASTNNYGFFSFTMLEGEKSIQASFIGYQSAISNFILKSDTTIFFRLSPGITLGEVDVVSSYKLRSSAISVERMSIQTISEIPSFVGEADIMKSLRFLPGVQLGSEISTGLVVRGGSPEQNLILLDGIPIYNTNHAFGLFSVFNSDAIKNVTLIKGGFPARYGGRLSSVIDVRMKEGDMKEFHGSATIGLIASKFTFEGPIIKDKSSFIISARRTYLDLFLLRPEGGDSDTPGFYFYDVNAKFNYQLSENDRLFYSFYLGSDKFSIKESESYNDESTVEQDNAIASWGNKTSLIRWNHLFSKKLFGNLSLLYSEYKLDIDVEETMREEDEYEYSLITYGSGKNDVSVKLDFDYYPSVVHNIKFGGNYTYQTFNPGKLRKVSEIYFYDNGVKTYPPDRQLDDFTRNDRKIAKEFKAYLEDDISFSKKFSSNIGIHYSGFLTSGKYYSSFEPRISSNYLVTDKLAVKGGFARMKQYIHLLAQSSLAMPTDLWLPVTKKVKPQYANQYTLGFVYNFNKMYELNLEGYYKTLDQIYTYKDGTEYLSSNNRWENNIEIGKGSSYGIEFMLRKHVGRLAGWLSYTYSKTTREFENVNYGRAFPYKYDRTHQVNAVAKYTFNPRLSLNATWVFATGHAYSFATKKYSSLFDLNPWNTPNNPVGYVDFYESRNNTRMPDYHRLDLSLVRVKKRKKTTRTWTVGTYNTYARFNPFLISWENTTQGKRRLKQTALFSIIPSLSYRIDF